MSTQIKENLQARLVNGLSELGEKIFLDRYAIKDAKKESLAVGDTVVVCVNLKTGQREIGTVEEMDVNERTVNVKLRDGSVEMHAIEHVDKPLETVPEQMFERISKHIASVELTEDKRSEWTGKFRELMEDWKYVPAGRIFTGAGTGQNLTYYNCYVIPSPKDSRHGIFETLGQMAEIMSRGGGVGINVSSLRPRYAYVKGVNGRSSGSVSWASLYSFVTGLIEQGGSRRGALMLILNVWHPDVIDFINSKKEAGRITNANISVGITDDFMEAVKQNKDWDLVFPDSQDPMYDKEWDGNLKRWRNLGGGVIKHKTVKAREIWDNIIESAWSSAEPGVYFIDRANYFSNSWYFAELPCTNPCGEQPLPAWGVCNLGHINLAKHLTQDTADVDWAMLKTTVQYAVRFQDNVIDATPYFFKQNFDQQMSERRVGMGTIGLAEMLIKLKVRYGSEEAVKFIEKLYNFIAIVAYETSVELSREKGAFGKFDADKFLESGFMKNMPSELREKIRAFGMRNVTILTQAPTGTVGTMVGTSTGIEPFYSWTYFRKSRLGVHQEHIRLARNWMESHEGQELPKYFVTAMELTPEEHVKVQAAVQKWTDSAISKTCNAPHDYTVDQTKKLYELMYDLGCKGGTIYRDGSRDEQILATDAKNLGKDVQDQIKTEEEKKDDMHVSPESAKKEEASAGMEEKNLQTLSLSKEASKYKIAPRERPTVLSGTTYKLNTAYGHLYVTINEDALGPFEVFASLGKTGGFFSAQTEAITRMISLALRSNIAVEEIVSQIKGIRGPDVTFAEGEMIYSLPDAIGKILEKHSKRGQKTLPLSKGGLESSVVKLPTENKEHLLSEMLQVETPKEDVVLARNVNQGSGLSQTSVSYEKSEKISIANLGNAPVCPTCTGMLIFQEGCMKCESCGYSKCG